MAGGTGCGEPEEATRHEVVVATDGSQLHPVDTNRGYTVAVEHVAIGAQSIEFTVGGQAHDDSELSWQSRLHRALLPRAHAHPNHAAGGTVGGVLEGPLIMEWTPGQTEPLGTATMLEGSYAGYNFDFSAPDTDADAAAAMLLDDDAMARIEATAIAEDDTEIAFALDIEHFDDARIVGGAFSGDIPGGEEAEIGLVFSPRDKWSERTIFDDISFSQYADGDRERVEIPSDGTTHTLIRLAITSHEFYGGNIMDTAEGG